MTEPDNFIQRWSRLKRQADVQHEIDPSRNDFATEPGEIGSVWPETATAQPRIDVASGGPFDPAGLPSIGAITAHTDVRGFLQSHVPAELTRAALRKAWTSDPAIRDFIGIAENQWNFNDPNAIAGFGPLVIADNELANLTQIPNMLEGIPEALSGLSASDGLALSSGPSALHEPARKMVVELPSAFTCSSRLSNAERGTGGQMESAAAVEEHGHFRNRRHHGSASPH